VVAAAPSTTDIAATAHTILSGAGGNILTFGQYPAGQGFAQWIQSSFGNPTTAVYNLVLQPLGGNVGIGTSSPSSRLDVLASTDAIGANLRGRSSDDIAVLKFATAANVETAAIDIRPGAAMIFAFGSSRTERMRIDSSGNLLVGTTTSNGIFTVSSGSNNANMGSFACTNASGPNYGISIGSAASAANTVALIRGFNSTSTLCFNVGGGGNVTNTNNSYGAISDAKLKENVTDATPKLEKLNQVRIVNFNMKGDEQKQLGVIAQELEQVFPGMVEETTDRDTDGNDLGTTTKSVKYSVFVPMLIKAIQEQQAMIAQLQADIASLKGTA